MYQQYPAEPCLFVVWSFYTSFISKYQFSSFCFSCVPLFFSWITRRPSRLSFLQQYLNPTACQTPRNWHSLSLTFMNPFSSPPAPHLPIWNYSYCKAPDWNHLKQLKPLQLLSNTLLIWPQPGHYFLLKGHITPFYTVTPRVEGLLVLHITLTSAPFGALCLVP